MDKIEEDGCFFLGGGRDQNVAVEIIFFPIVICDNRVFSFANSSEGKKTTNTRN